MNTLPSGPRTLINTSLKHTATGAACVLALGVMLASSFLQDAEPDAEQAATEPSADAESGTIPECKIILTSGSTISGMLMESHDDRVVVRINGIDTRIDRSHIASIRFLPPIEERYKNLKRGIPRTDIDARLTLVDWLRKRRAYDLALEEIDSVIEDAPSDLRAKDVREWIVLQRDLQSKRAPKQDPAPSRSIQTSDNTPGIRALTDEEINLVRVFEVDLDNPPRMNITDGTLQTLMERRPNAFPVDPSERAAMLSLPAHEQLRVLFSNQARDLYTQVDVLEDPESLAMFRTSIAGATGWLTNACATTRCHGGTEAGDFRLLRENPNSDTTVYTNFVIINGYTLDDGRPLINTSEPARSPLLQLAMLRSGSQTPHPEVDPLIHGRDWRPVMRNPRDRAYGRVVEWIQTLYAPRPDYGIPDPLAPMSEAP